MLQESEQHGTGVYTSIQIDGTEMRVQRKKTPIYGQMIFNRFLHDSMVKEQSFQQMALEQLGFTCEGITLDPYLTSCTKIDSKWFKDLNLRDKTLLKESKDLHKQKDICVHELEDLHCEGSLLNSQKKMDKTMISQI